MLTLSRDPSAENANALFQIDYYLISQLTLTFYLN